MFDAAGHSYAVNLLAVEIHNNVLSVISREVVVEYAGFHHSIGGNIIPQLLGPGPELCVSVGSNLQADSAVIAVCKNILRFAQRIQLKYGFQGKHAFELFDLIRAYKEINIAVAVQTKHILLDGVFIYNFRRTTLKTL